MKPSNINGFKDFICGTPEGTRTPDLLVRSQSLYPAELPARNTLLNCKYALYTKTTVWFVASHSIQLSYRRICNRLSLLLKYYNILQSKMQVFFDYYIMKMWFDRAYHWIFARFLCLFNNFSVFERYIPREILHSLRKDLHTGAFCNTAEFVFRELAVFLPPCQALKARGK